MEVITLFKYKDLTNLESTKPPKIENGILTLKNDENLEFVSFLNNKELTEIRFESEQSKLRYLDLSYSAIEKISFYSECPNLQSINIHGSEIESGALSKFEILVSLPKLKLIDLSYNKNLKEINISADLPGLRFLYLKGCGLRDLQNLAKYFVHPELDFNIGENEKLQSPPIEIAKQGKNAIINYFRSIYKDEKVEVDYLFEAKLMVIGDGGVGKTSFVVKMHDKNNKLPEKDDTTYGIKVSKRKFDVEHYDLGKREMFANIWDFGGQDLYKGTHQMFFSKKSLYVLIDATREASTDYAYWINTVKQLAGEGSKLLIISNKKNGRVPDRDENGLLRYFGKLITDFIEIDLSDSSTKIDELQTDIKNLLLKLPDIGSPLSPTWVKIRNKLFEIDKPYISYERYKGICKSANHPTDNERLDFLSEYFNRIGVFTHYYDDNLLRERVFLDSNWLIKTVYNVLDHDIAKNQKGVLNEADIKTIWQEEIFDEKSKLTRLMHRFGLMYKVENEDIFIVPKHLSSEQPYKKWEYEAEKEVLQFIYQFDKYMPRGIMSVLIVFLHEYITNQNFVWKKGVNLTYENDTFAEITETYDKENKYLIRIFGTQKILFLGIIIREFERILKPFVGLEFDRLIPCNCPKCITAPKFFKYSDLMEIKKKNERNYIRCNESDDKVVIDKLLEGIRISDNTDEPKRSSDSTPPQPGINIVINNTNIKGNDNASFQDIKESKIDYSHNKHTKDYSENFEKLESLIKTLFDKLSLEHQSSYNQIILEIGNKSEKEQNILMQEVLKFVKDLKDEKEQEKAKKIIDDNRIDITSKFKVVIPLIFAQYEMEFTTKNKFPGSIAELKALFIK